MNTVVVTFNQLLRSPRLFVAFGFGSGLSPKAPGTMGTLVGVLVFFWMGKLSLYPYLLLLFLAAILGVYLCDGAAKMLGVHDHGGIVWDEMVGYWITMIALPVSWQWMLAGFILFRFFDICKPWPVSWADKQVKGGLGIMLDDVLAGLMSWAILMAVWRLLV